MTKKELEYLRNNEERTLITVACEISKAFHEKIMENDEILFKKDETSRRILGILTQTPGITQSDIVRAIHMKGSTVSIAISKMESMGLIKRVESTSDKRATRVFLTEKGYNHSKKTKAILDSQEHTLMQGIAPNDAKKAFDVLEMILENLATE